jgi:hypothetical protein
MYFSETSIEDIAIQPAARIPIVDKFTQSVAADGASESTNGTVAT